MKKILLVFLLFFITSNIFCQTFTKKILLDNCYGRETEWGDFDNDGDLDILIFYTNENAYGTSHTCILENKIDSFTILNVGLPEVEYFGSSRNGAANWFDFNNDGFLDICLIIGEPFSAKIKIYKNNDNKTFTDIKCDSILDIVPGSCGPSFADYDNDGDLDILLMGSNKTTYKEEIRIFENIGNGKFIASDIRNIEGIIKSRMPWCDFNNDGYLDILANEPKPVYTSNIVIYKNNGNKTFTKISYPNLQGLNNDYLNQAGDMRWGDYNSDGFADIVISGAHTGSTGVGITKIYKNNGDETFTESGINNIYGMAMDVSMEWGDYNNDGILDILQCGDGWINGVIGKTRIFYNNNGSFIKDSINSFLEIHQQGMSTAADYDNDGDLDILNLGEVDYIHHQIALFKNNIAKKNTKPEIPTNLQMESNGNITILKWDKTNDNETPSNGLSYNIYLIKNDTIIIVAPNTLASGKRTSVGIGNAQQNNFFNIKNLSAGYYKWSVQSIDNSFEGSIFAVESNFNIDNTGIKNETDNVAINVYPNPFTNFFNINNSNNKNSIYNINLYDFMGRTLMKINNISLLYIPFKLTTKSGLN